MSNNEIEINGIKYIRKDLCGADLYGADLCCAILRGANLRGADLYGANLRDADLCDADLRGAKYSILNLLTISFYQLSNELTLELMRHDAEFIGNKTMDEWANGGDCPYKNMERDFSFQEKKELWKKGKPKLRGIELWRALCKEKNIKINI